MKNLATNRRTTAINAGSEASESGDDVELGHNHGACASFQKFSFFKRLRVYHASQTNVKDIFEKTVQKYQTRPSPYRRLMN
jgi:hypothetical protein